MARTNRWIDFITTFSVSADALVQFVPLENELPDVEDRKGFTIERIILSCQVAATTEVFVSRRTGLIACGLGIAGQEAIDVGVTAMPDPSVSREKPATGWLWRDSKFMVAGIDPGYSDRMLTSFEVDLHSKRKLDFGNLVLLVRNDAIATGFGVDGQLMIRTLLKAP